MSICHGYRPHVWHFPTDALRGELIGPPSISQRSLASVRGKHSHEWIICNKTFPVHFVILLYKRRRVDGTDGEYQDGKKSCYMPLDLFHPIFLFCFYSFVFFVEQLNWDICKMFLGLWICVIIAWANVCDQFWIDLNTKPFRTDDVLKAFLCSLFMNLLKCSD